MQKSIMCGCRILWFIPLKSNQGITPLAFLTFFMNHSNQTVAVRIWSQPYAVDEVKTADGKEFKLINLPFYLVGKLDSILRRFETTFDNA